MLETEIIDALIYRIQQEQLSSRIYEQMSIWFDLRGYKNLAKLYNKYAHEELSHAEWAKKFLLSYNENFQLQPLEAPNAAFSGVSEILQLTLEHEQEITNQCNELAKLASSLQNYPCFELALKFCREQVEELEKAFDLVDMYTLSNNDLLFEHSIENLL